jgi:hypothetical protein
MLAAKARGRGPRSGENRSAQPNAKPHSVLRVVAKVVFRQSPAQQRAKKDAAQRQNKNYAGKGQSAHGLSRYYGQR